MDSSWLRPDLVVVGVYLAAMLLLAWWVSDGSRDVEGYALGNRRMSGWSVGLSVLGTFTSSISFLAYPASAYRGNWNAYVFGLALPLAAWVAVACFVPLYRAAPRLSAYGFLDDRFGGWARGYAAGSYLLLQLVRVAMVLVLLALAVAPLLDWQVVPTIVLVGLLVLIYDVLGGLAAVVWTDVWQVVILFGGALWCLVQLGVDYPGGPGALWQAIPAEKLSLGSLNPWDVSTSTVWVVLVYGLSENLRNYGTDQAYVQRMLCTDSRRSAAQALWIGALSYVPLSVIFFAIGTSLFAYYQAHEGLLPPGLKAEQVFPHFIRSQLPLGVAGLVVAAIMAAAMSTIDSCLNSMSTVILSDIVRPLRGSRPPRIPEILTLRLATAVSGLAGTALAAGVYVIYRDGSQTIVDLWFQSAGTLGGGLFGLFLLAWLLPRTPAWAAALAVAATIPVLAWGTFARDLAPESAWAAWQCPLERKLVGIAGTTVILVLGGLASLLATWGVISANPRAALIPASDLVQASAAGDE